MVHDDHTLTRASQWKVIGFCFFVAFGGFLFGYDIGVISGCLVMPDFIRRFGNGQTDAEGNLVLNADRQSVITSLLSAGTFVGALGQAFTADSLGRKASIQFWSAIFTVGVVIQTASVTSTVQLVIGRFIAGLGVGAMSAIVPLYNGEAAPKHLRGTLLCLYQLMIIIGLFLSYCIDLGTHKISTSASWRIPVGIQILWGLILIVGPFFLPESPRYLLGKQRTEEARRSIAISNGVSVDHPVVGERMEELEVAIREENEGGKVSWFECFSTRNVLWKRTLNGMMLQFIQQLNGQNFYYYFGPVFFQAAGTDLDPLKIQTILGGVSVAGTIPALYLIETTGRRKMLMIGAVGQAISALIAGVGGNALVDQNTPKEDLTAANKTGGKLLIAFAVIHVLFFSTFWGPTPWTYLGESFPLRVRAKCIALGSATNWVWNFLLGFFAPRIAKDIGPLILLIFFGMLVFGFFYTYFMIPETKGLSLEQVDEMYREGVKPWQSANWQPSHGTKRAAKFHGTEAGYDADNKARFSIDEKRDTSDEKVGEA
ncbi:sugar transporter [Atractiella rhizophila]|nr:sugar transporter [Atractiella rhizophila]